eukprot:5793580-Prymnesium_polylepis.2
MVCHGDAPCRCILLNLGREFVHQPVGSPVDHPSTVHERMNACAREDVASAARPRACPNLCRVLSACKVEDHPTGWQAR